MSMDLKLHLKQAQKLVMTANLQQAIKLLQLSRIELEQFVAQEMLENPVLEELTVASAEDRDVGTEEEPLKESGKLSEESGNKPSEEDLVQSEVDWERYFDAGQDVGYEPAGDQEPVYYENFVRTAESLQDHLIWQLQMTTLSDQERRLGYLIIGNLSDDGYFREDIAEPAAAVGMSVVDSEKVLYQIQRFDPVGIAARNLKECLLRQIEPFPDLNPLAKVIIEEHLGLLQKKHYPEIAKALKVTLEEIREPIDLIEHLEPKPGREYDTEPSHYVTPDVYVEKVDGQFAVFLNDEGLPRLRVSRFYQSLLKSDTSTNGNESAKEYLDKKLRSALWLIKSVEQRQRTIYKVAESIVRMQQEFFEKGLSYLRPMVLKDVAEDIGMHESTISRVSNNKYIHSPQGVHEIKFFFHSGLSSASGEDVSSLRIKEIIKQEISEEDARKPLSDQKLMEILEKKLGVEIARRTVAKYRIDLGIPSSSQRKSL